MCLYLFCAVFCLRNLGINQSRQQKLWMTSDTDVRGTKLIARMFSFEWYHFQLHQRTASTENHLEAALGAAVLSPSKHRQYCSDRAESFTKGAFGRHEVTHQATVFHSQYSATSHTSKFLHLIWRFDEDLHIVSSIAPNRLPVLPSKRATPCHHFGTTLVWIPAITLFYFTSLNYSQVISLTVYNSKSPHMIQSPHTPSFHHSS